MTRAELLDRLDVLLGGRVAEEIIFGDVSTGAHDDLQRASDLARHMVTQYGMSDELGLATFEKPQPPLFLNGSVAGERPYSEETARTIDREVRKLLADAHIRVRETLSEQLAVLEALAKSLIEKEVVDREALMALLTSSFPRSPRGEHRKRADSREPHMTSARTPRHLGDASLLPSV